MRSPTNSTPPIYRKSHVALVVGIPDRVQENLDLVLVGNPLSYWLLGGSILFVSSSSLGKQGPS